MLFKDEIILMTLHFASHTQTGQNCSANSLSVCEYLECTWNVAMWMRMVQIEKNNKNKSTQTHLQLRSQSKSKASIHKKTHTTWKTFRFCRFASTWETKKKPSENKLGEKRLIIAYVGLKNVLLWDKAIRIVAKSVN